MDKTNIIVTIDTFDLSGHKDTSIEMNFREMQKRQEVPDIEMRVNIIATVKEYLPMLIDKYIINKDK